MPPVLVVVIIFTNNRLALFCTIVSWPSGSKKQKHFHTLQALTAVSVCRLCSPANSHSSSSPSTSRASWLSSCPGCPSGSITKRYAYACTDGEGGRVYFKILLTPLLENLGPYVVKKESDFLNFFFYPSPLWPTGPCTCMAVSLNNAPQSFACLIYLLLTSLHAYYSTNTVNFLNGTPLIFRTKKFILPSKIMPLRGFSGNRGKGGHPGPGREKCPNSVSDKILDIFCMKNVLKPILL